MKNEIKKILYIIGICLMFVALIASALITIIVTSIEFSEKVALTAVYITIFFSIFSFLQHYFERNESIIEIEKEMNRVYEIIKKWVDEVILNRFEGDPSDDKTHKNTMNFFKSIQGTDLIHQIYKYLKIFAEIEPNSDFRLYFDDSNYQFYQQTRNYSGYIIYLYNQETKEYEELRMKQREEVINKVQKILEKTREHAKSMGIELF